MLVAQPPPSAGAGPTSPATAPGSSTSAATTLTPTPTMAGPSHSPAPTSVTRPKRAPKPITPRAPASSLHARPPTSESRRTKTTFTSARSYPENASFVLQPIPVSAVTGSANGAEGELARSSRKSKVEALSRIERAGSPQAMSATSAPTATSFLPAPPPPVGPSILRNPLYRPRVVNPPFDISSVRVDAPRYPEKPSTRLFGLETCPTFYPTREEFLDPMEYITSLGPQAKPYGMCKIVPPEGWRMPFSLSTDTFRFKTRAQTINSLEAASRAKVNFLEQLTMFHNQQGDASVSIPLIDRKPLDLWRLRKEVHKAGGPLELNRVNGWQDLSKTLEYDPIWQAPIKEAYQQIIKPFDDFVLRAKAKTNSAGTGSPLTPDSGTYSKPPGFADTPGSPTRSRMSGMRSVQKPLSSGPLSTISQLASTPITTVKIKVPGFAKSDGSESELSEEESSPKSTRSGKPTEVAPTPYVKGDVCEICRGGHAAPKILLCDGCDRGYHIYCLDPPLHAVPTNEEWYCTTCLLGQGDDFGFEEGDEHSITSFQARDAAFSYAWWNKHRPMPSTSLHEPELSRTFGKVSVTEDDVEREFWRLTESATDSVEVEYGADVHSTTHGSAGPTKETHPLDPYSVDPWNLNNMPILKESLLRYIKSDISGMTVPWIYLGMMFSAFCWHNEDHYTYSVNYMHWGETKTWYGIPGCDAEKFEQAIKSEAPELFEQQPALLYQLVTMMNPGRLKQAGVRVVAADQRPNEFIITWPKAYHCGFNHGINFNEAVNFALPDWLPVGRECVERYKHFAKVPVFSHDELLITITLFSDTIKTALWLKESLSKMVEEESELRARIRNDIPQLAEILVEEDCAEEQYQCCICKSLSYLSQVTCSCTNLVACIDHAEQLCACPTNKRTLRIRYSENQLEEILAAVDHRASVPALWKSRLDHLLDTNPRPPLKSMRALLTDGERISHPMLEVEDLRELVTRANAWVDKVTTLTNRKVTGRRRTGRQGEEEEEQDKSPAAIAELIRQAMSLAFDSPEIPQLRQLFQSIEVFKNEAGLILSTPEDELDLGKCNTALILGNSLNIELPEIATITTIVRRLEWFQRVEEEVDDRTLSYKEVVDLLSDADECEIPSSHPSIVELQNRRDKGQAWKTAVEELYKAEQIHVDNVSALIDGQELTPTDLDTMRQLENMRKQATTWQSSAISFLGGVGTATAAARLCKAVSSAHGPLGRMVIPEVAELQQELDFHAKWLKQLGNFLATPPTKVGAALAIIYRSVEALLKPEDDLPNDRFVCFCRGPVTSPMISCENCKGSYHPKCVGLTPKQLALDRPFQCAMCDTPVADDRPSLNLLAGFSDQTKWNFILAPVEFATISSLTQICVRISGLVLQVCDPLDEKEPCLDIDNITHLSRKLFNLPVVFDAWHSSKNVRVIFEVWLRKRWFDARDAKVASAALVSKAAAKANGVAKGKGIAMAVAGNASGATVIKNRGRLRRPKLVLAKAKEGQFNCICETPPLDHLLQVKCQKCRQGYHATCVRAPLEAMGPESKWRCPCCAVKEGKLYLKGVEIRVQATESLGTDTYIDYRTTVSTYVSSPVLVQLPEESTTASVIIILECIGFVEPVIPEVVAAPPTDVSTSSLVNDVDLHAKRKSVDDLEARIDCQTSDTVVAGHLPALPQYAQPPPQHRPSSEKRARVDIAPSFNGHQYAHAERYRQAYSTPGSVTPGSGIAVAHETTYNPAPSAGSRFLSQPIPGSLSAIQNYSTQGRISSPSNTPTQTAASTFRTQPSIAPASATRSSPILVSSSPVMHNHARPGHSHSHSHAPTPGPDPTTSALTSSWTTAPEPLRQSEADRLKHHREMLEAQRSQDRARRELLERERERSRLVQAPARTETEQRPDPRGAQSIRISDEDYAAMIEKAKEDVRMYQEAKRRAERIVEAVRGDSGSAPGGAGSTTGMFASNVSGGRPLGIGMGFAKLSQPQFSHANNGGGTGNTSG